MNKTGVQPLTPLEVVDYKNRWRTSATMVRTHSDIVDVAKTWCRRNLDRWEWSMTAYTDVYEHTFEFELVENADAFCEYINAQYPDRRFASL